LNAGAKVVEPAVSRNALGLGEPASSGTSDMPAVFGTNASDSWKNSLHNALRSITSSVRTGQSAISKPSPLRCSRSTGRVYEVHKNLCHNCDIKPALADKTDFIDDWLLLILRNLLKTQRCQKYPAYRLIR